jgi:hypothetical protein
MWMMMTDSMKVVSFIAGLCSEYRVWTYLRYLLFTIYLFAILIYYLFSTFALNDSAMIQDLCGIH